MDIPRIGPSNAPFTVAEVREHVAELLTHFAGEPGIELVGLIAGMLEQTRCHCQPHATGHSAAVLALPTPTGRTPAAGSDVQHGAPAGQDVTQQLIDQETHRPSTGAQHDGQPP